MNKKFTIFSISALTLAGVAVIGIANQTSNGLVFNKAEGCEHHVVEHYGATATAIEHWACCECHHAWADEARTILVSENTSFERELIEVATPYYNVSHVGTNYEYIWDDTELFATFDSSEFDISFAKTFDGMTEAYFQTVSADRVDDDVVYTIKVTNNSDATITVRTVNRSWTVACETKTIQANQTGYLKIDGATWNSGVFSNPTHPNYGQPQYGFCVHVTPTAEAKGTVTVSTPITDTLIDYVENNGQIAISAKDETYGRTYTIDNASGGQPVSIYGRRELDPAKYSGVKVWFYHESGQPVTFNAWSEDWGTHGPHQTIVPSGQWKSSIIPLNVWNGHINGCACLSPADNPDSVNRTASKRLSFYDTAGLNGKFIFAIEGLEVPEYYTVSHTETFAEEDWVWDSHDVSGKFNATSGLNDYTFNFTNRAQAFFNTIDASSKAEEGLTYEIQVTNNTNATLSIVTVNKSWVVSCASIELRPGYTNLVEINSTVWTGGYSVRVMNANGGTYTGSVTVSTPTLKQTLLANEAEFAAQTPENWTVLPYSVSLSVAHGRVYTFDMSLTAGATPRTYFRQLVELDTELYSGVEVYFYHESGRDVQINITTEDWTTGGYQGFTIPSNTWHKGTLNPITWNGNRASQQIGFYEFINLTGVYSFAIKGFIAK